MLIGAHDSCAYKVDLTKSFWPWNNKFELLRKASYGCVKTKIEQLTKTQKLNIRQQLELGCRIFDIRVSYLNRSFYATHTFCNGLLYEVFEEIYNFANSNPTQITLLIRPDWNNKESLQGKENILLNSIEIRFSHLLERKKIICYCDFHSKFLDGFEYFKSYNSLDDIYFDVNNVEDFKKKLAGKNRNMSRALLFFVLTVKEDSSFNELMNSSIENLAGEINSQVEDIFKTYIGLHKPMAVLFDFVDENLMNRVAAIK